MRGAILTGAVAIQAIKFTVTFRYLALHLHLITQRAVAMRTGELTVGVRLGGQGFLNLASHVDKESDGSGVSPTTSNPSALGDPVQCIRRSCRTCALLISFLFNYTRSRFTAVLYSHRSTLP